MSEMQNTTGISFGEKFRRMRMQRRQEKTTFRQELRIIPRWVVGLVWLLYAAAELGGWIANFRFHAFSNVSGELWPYAFRYDPVMSALCVAGLITVMALPIATLILMIAYVNRDSARRGMNSALWTFLVIVLSSGWGALGFVIYFLMREPLPYGCAQCGAKIGAQFNFCPNCRLNLHPWCPNCRREVAELDKFCPYCAQDLAARTLPPATLST